MGRLLRGMVFKNYKHLCSYMGWDYVGGSTKEKNLKELDKLCTYKRDGFKYKITSSNPKIVEDKKPIGGRSTYVQPLEVLVMDYLKKASVKAKDGIVVIGKMELLENLNLIDIQMEKIFRLDYVPPTAEIDINSKTFKVFKQEVLNLMQSKLISCLNSMQKRRLIDFKEVVYINTNNGETRLATEKEEEELERIKNITIAKMGYSHLGVINFVGKMEDYRDLFKNILKESKVSYIDNHAKALKLVLKGGLTPYPYNTPTHVQIALERLLELFKAYLNKRGTKILEANIKNKENFIEKLANKRTLEKIYNKFSVEELESISPVEIDGLYELEYPVVYAQIQAQFLDSFQIMDLNMWDTLLNCYFPPLETQANSKLLKMVSTQFLSYIKH